MFFFESFKNSNPMLDWTSTRGSTAGLPMMDTFPGYGVFQSPTSMWMSTLDDESDRGTPSPRPAAPAESSTADASTSADVQMDMMMDVSTTTTATKNNNDESNKYWSIVQSSYSEDKPPSWVEVKIGFPEMGLGKADSHIFHSPPTPPATPPVPEYYPSAAAHSIPIVRKSSPKPKSPKTPFRELNVSKVQKIRTTTNPTERNRRSGAPSPTSLVPSSGSSAVRKSHSVPPKANERRPMDSGFDCVYYQRSSHNGKKVYGSVTTFNSGPSSASNSVRERKQHDQREKRLAAAFEAGFLEHLFGKRTTVVASSTPVSPTSVSPPINRIEDLSGDVDMDMDMEQGITNPGTAPADDEFPAPPAAIERMTPSAEGEDISELRKRFEKILK